MWFVPLAPLADVGLVAAAVAQVLGAREAAGLPLAAALSEFLGDKRLLLVLDNFEHLLGAAPLVAELLAVGPGVTALVTSRAVLRLSGEHAYAVPPLALPDVRDVPTAERLTKSAAVRLFVERARAARADFALTAETAPAVAELCRRLDGLPLALELAAARVRLLSPPDLLARLGRRLPLLTGGARDAPARHQTLRAAIEWSYDLLAPGEQALFRRLAVFAGGCVLEAAEAVCAGGLRFDLLDAMQALVDHSLLRQEEAANGAGGPSRLEMLETVREYALERLEASGEAGALRAAHAAHHLDLAERAELALRGPQQLLWLDRLEREHDNLRPALRWFADAGESQRGLRMAAALVPFWDAHGHWREGRECIEGLLALRQAQAPTAEPIAVLGRALCGAGTLAFQQGDTHAAAAYGYRSLDLARDAGDDRAVGRVHNLLGHVTSLRGDYATARGHFEASLAVWRELKDGGGISDALIGLGTLAAYERDLAGGRALWEEALDLQREIGNRRNIATLLSYLGKMTAYDREFGRARELLEEALVLSRGLGDRGAVAYVLSSLGVAATLSGDFPAARDVLVESLVLRRALGDKAGVAECLEGLAEVIGASGAPVRAARLLGAAEALRAAIGVPLPSLYHETKERRITVVRSRLSGQAFTAACAAGRAMSLEQAVACALEAPAAPAAPGGLTPREREVAVRVARGDTNAEIARALVIAPRTAMRHVEHVMAKLGVHSRAQIAAWAAHQGLLGSSAQ